MGMSNGRDSLTRISFEIQSDNASISTLDLDINPQSMSEIHSARTYLQQVRTANSVQNFGAGAVSYTISGNTGWKAGTSDPGRGFDKIKEFRNFFTTYLSSYSDDVGTDYSLILHDYTNEIHVYIEFQPEGFSFTQDVSQPILYNYTLQLYVVGDASTPSSSDISSTVLGNTKSSISSTDTNSSGNYINPTTSSSSTSIGSNALGKALGVG